MSEPRFTMADIEINDKFEREAEEFHKETGMLPPGKDDARGVDSYEDRCNAWVKWQAEKKVKANDMISRQTVTTMLEQMARVQIPASHYAETITKNKYHVPTLQDIKDNIEAMPAAGEGE